MTAGLKVVYLVELRVFLKDAGWVDRKEILMAAPKDACLALMLVALKAEWWVRWMAVVMVARLAEWWDMLLAVRLVGSMVEKSADPKAG